jgi:Sphingosine kinase and enzymes related to eukaryotic diacylglycerol kinase
LKKCLVVLNRTSGGFNKKIEDKVRQELSSFSVEFADIDSDYLGGVQSGRYAALCVCGGDGTLNSVVNKIRNESVELYYYPCGTLNERAKSRFQQNGRLLVGNVGNEIFTYVYACGSFTPIGYTAEIKAKRKYKTLAYISRAVSEYRVHDIPARLVVDGRTFDGRYTLIMVIKSKRCFGFPFNRLYSPDEKTAHLLLIKSAGRDGLINRIKMFFPFFRAFFIGFNKEKEGKNVTFLRFSELNLELNGDVDFCVDGEKRTAGGRLSFSIDEISPKFTVLNPRSRHPQSLNTSQ